MHRSFLLMMLLVSGLHPQTAWGTAAQPPLSCPSLEEPLQFDNYWVGPSFEGLHLVSVIRVCIPEDPAHGNTVEYLYESCSEFDVGCDRRIEVRIASTPFSEGHRQNLDLYGKATSVGGVPGRFFGAQLAIYLPETTVFISRGDSVSFYGDDEERWYRFGRALRKGPGVLADLAAYGIRFPQECRAIVRCEGESVAPQGMSLLQRGLNVLSVVILILLFGVAPLLILRRRGDQALFALEPRLFRVAVAFFAVAGVMLYGLLRLSFVFWLPGMGMAIAAFLVAGASLRPRGGYARGVALGGLAYLLIGLVSHAVLVRPESLAQFLTQESFLFVVLGWPALPALVLAGSLG